jgi:hypothetical protein
MKPRYNALTRPWLHLPCLEFAGNVSTRRAETRPHCLVGEGQLWFDSCALLYLCGCAAANDVTIREALAVRTG